ncbi:MAG: hypothetical protein GX621_17460, partial [Pirellulaceae bacterium]|nr:hypothetical protein [Pirellulaceae bacterium]
MPPSRHATRRTYFISLAFAVTVAAICFVVQWQRSGEPRRYLDGYYYGEILTVESIGRAIDQWRETHGKLPESLAILDGDEHQSDLNIRLNDEGEVIDRWGNPLAYRIEGDSFELLSYGEDGKPGGTWFDSDIVHGDPYPPESFPPSLGVFWSSEQGSKAIMLAMLTGLFCFVCGFVLLREEAAPADATDEQRAEFKRRQRGPMASRLLGLTVV